MTVTYTVQLLIRIMANMSGSTIANWTCPGMNIAEQSLYLPIARMAWTCEIQKRPGVKIP
jgi:hypothetical protein